MCDGWYGKVADRAEICGDEWPVVSLSVNSLKNDRSPLGCSFSKVFWIDGTSPETMEASIAAVATADEDARASGVGANSSSVLQWLASRKQNWLMIFDGADGGYEAVQAFIPAGKHGNILISTRNSDLQRLASSDAFINVAELDQDAAVTLFIRSARLNEPDPNDIAHIKEIVRELCYLPLAVDQAAACIASNLCRIADYPNTYKQHRCRLLDDCTFKGASNYGRAAYTTLEISFAELERRANMRVSDSTTYKAAILLLKLFSFFHFDGIREDTFRRAAKTRGKWLPPYGPDSQHQAFLLFQQTEDNDWDFNFCQAIRVLSMFSLVHSAGSGTYSMHRLVHQWVQDRLHRTQYSAMGLLAADVLARSEDHGESSDDYAHRRALLVHLIALTARLKQNDLMHQLSADTLQRMAWTYRHGRKPLDAEVLLRQAASLVKEDNSEAAEQYMSIRADLAAALYDSGKLSEAEVIERHVLEWREQYLGTYHLSTIRTRSNLALTLYQLGQYGAAKEMQVQVVDWQKKHLGMDHRDTYLTMGGLANTLCQLGELAEARGLEEQVLEWQKLHLGMDHPDTYRTMGNLAVTLRELGELAEAKGLQKQVLKWEKAHLGMDHPDTYQTMGSLAITLRDLGELTKAKRLQAQVLKWQKAHLGMDQPDTYQTMGSLAITLRDLGELAKVRALEMRVFKWQKMHLGMDHPGTYRSMERLANTLADLGELAEARALELQVFKWRKVYLGMDHPDTRQIMGNLAIILPKLGELAEARGSGAGTRKAETAPQDGPSQYILDYGQSSNRTR
jgi:tetratricopeptide (TPR) repeat protein